MTPDDARHTARRIKKRWGIESVVLEENGIHYLRVPVYPGLRLEIFDPRTTNWPPVKTLLDHSWIKK